MITTTFYNLFIECERNIERVWKILSLSSTTFPVCLLTGTGISRGIREDTECYMNGIWLYILSITTFYILNIEWERNIE